MTPITLLLTALLGAASAARAAESTTTLHGVDLYRTNQVSLEFIESKLGGVMRGYARQKADPRPALRKSAEGAEARLEADLRKLGKFAYLEIYYSPYFSSLERSNYITIDVVDESDKGERMPFRPAPTGSPADPDGLLAAWKEYNALGESLSRAGTINVSERPACPSYFCVWGSATPELAALEKKIAAGAPARRKELLNSFENDSDPADRAAALFVLAYEPEGREIADHALKSLKDPAVEVRVAGLQILADLGLYHKDVFIDLTRLLPALDYPSTPERTQAMGALVGLADNPTYRPFLLARATPRLLELLKLKQPSSHDLAFTLLSLLSKETYGRRDYDAWAKWVFQQQSAAPVPPPAKK